MKCNACSKDALIVYRVVPHSATRTLFDTTPRDIASCAAHIQAAKAIGTVLSATALSSDVVQRTVKD